MESVKKKTNVLYLENIANLHDAAKELLDDLINAQMSIFDMEQQQEYFRDRFGKTNGELAFEIVTEKRNIKRLRRSYEKIIQKINATL